MNLAELVEAGLAREGVAVIWSRAGRRSYAGDFWATSIIGPVNTIQAFRAAAQAGSHALLGSRGLSPRRGIPAPDQPGLINGPVRMTGFYATGSKRSKKFP
jgi:hypothetical protein